MLKFLTPNYMGNSTFLKSFISKLMLLSIVSTLFISTPVYAGSTTVGLTLSQSSPSGSRVVSKSDDFFVFNLHSYHTLPAGSIFNVEVVTDNDLDPLKIKNGQIKVYLRDKGVTIGKGTFYMDSSRTGIAALADIQLHSALELPEDYTTLTLNTDTADLLMEDIGIDDPVVTTVSYNGMALIGNTVKY